MKSIMKKFGYFGTIVIIIFSSLSCNSNSNVKTNTPNKINNIFITDNIWGKALIEDRVTINNINFFINKLKPSSYLKSTDLILDAAIKVNINFKGSVKEMYFTETWAFDGETVYEGPNIRNIYALLDKNLYSIKQLEEVAKKSLSITLYAKDIATEKRIINKVDFIKAINDSSYVSGDLDQVQRLPIQYPYYNLTIKLPNNNKLDITLKSKEYFIINDNNQLNTYSSNGNLWRMGVSLFGIPKPTPDKVSYLFQAREMSSLNWQGNLIHKKNYIIRALLEAKPTKQKPPTNSYSYIITFNINNKQVPIKIYKDFFEYNKNLYFYKDINQVIEKIISAG